MKLTPNQKHNLRELQKLVAAVHGPQAKAVPDHSGVQFRVSGAYKSLAWFQLADEMARLRLLVVNAATSPKARIAEVRAKADAEVADLRAREAEDVAEIEARAERCRALLGPLPQKVKP